MITNHHGRWCLIRWPAALPAAIRLLLTGMVNGQPADVFPFPLTAADLQRGQALFNGICAPCHDRAGTGDGVVVERGFTPPPTFHSDRLRSAPAGHFFDVITNGFGAMPAYGPIIQVPDRWRIMGYIRALQLSQDATLEDVPPNLRDQLGTAPALPTSPPSAAITACGTCHHRHRRGWSHAGIGCVAGPTTVYQRGMQRLPSDQWQRTRAFPGRRLRQTGAAPGWADGHGR